MRYINEENNLIEIRALLNIMLKCEAKLFVDNNVLYCDFRKNLSSKIYRVEIPDMIERQLAKDAVTTITEEIIDLLKYEILKEYFV